MPNAQKSGWAPKTHLDVVAATFVKFVFGMYSNNMAATQNLYLLFNFMALNKERTTEELGKWNFISKSLVCRM
jgi:hypothetical protein